MNRSDDVRVPHLKSRVVALVLIGLALNLNPRVALSQGVSPDFFSGLRWRLIGPFRGGRAVAVCGVPGDSKTFYFGAVDGGVWKTTDAGTVWLPVFDDQPVASIGAIAVAPSDANVIYAGTGESDIRSDLASGDGVYKSTDAGKSWRNIGLRDSRQISRIVIDPRNPDIVYVGVLGHAYGANEERGVYKSTDGGVTWKRILNTGPDVGVSDLAIAAKNSQVLIAGTWNARRPPWSTYAPISGPGSGLYRSADGGESWIQLTSHGLPDGDWGRVGVAISADGKRVYALIEAKASGLYRSDDGGYNWTRENSDPRLTTRAWYFNSLTIDPSDPDVLYVPNIALYRSSEGGRTISVLRGAPGGDDYHQLWVDPKDSSNLILGSDQGASISLDHGKPWTSWYNITLNGGKTWANVTPKGLNAWSNVSMIEASHFDKGEAYAAIDRHEVDDYRPYIYRTRDFGQNWQRIDTGIASGAFLRAVRQDPKKKSLLFAGTELGLYVSFDDGDHWQPLQLNLPVSSVRDLQIHGDDLVVATHGRSFWILDDMEPLRQIYAGIVCPSACFFRPATAVRVDNNAFSGTPLPPEEPAANNPPEGAVLDYVLPRRANEVTLTIFDQQHEIVRRFSSTDKEAERRSHAAVADRWFPPPLRIENAAGMHRFVWDLRWRYSGNTAADNESGSAAPSGPRVPPGSYEVKLTVDGKHFTQRPTVTMDPRSSASISLLNEQFRLGREILDESLQSRATLAEVDLVHSELADLTPEQLAEHHVLLEKMRGFEEVLHDILAGDMQKSHDINGLISANAGLDAALNAVEGGDRTVPPQVLELCQQSKKEARKQISAWAAAKRTSLSELNQTLQEAGLAPVSISEIEEDVQVLRAW